MPSRFMYWLANHNYSLDHTLPRQDIMIITKLNLLLIWKKMHLYIFITTYVSARAEELGAFILLQRKNTFKDTIGGHSTSFLL